MFERVRLGGNNSELARDKKVGGVTVHFLDDTQHVFPIDVSPLEHFHL